MTDFLECKHTWREEVDLLCEHGMAYAREYFGHISRGKFKGILKSWPAMLLSIEQIVRHNAVKMQLRARMLFWCLPTIYHIFQSYAFLHRLQRCLLDETLKILMLHCH